MNPMTGELANPLFLSEEYKKLFKELPERLQAEAQAKLAGRDRAMTDISDDSELSEWARRMREYQTEKPDGQAAQRRLCQLQKKLAKIEK